MTINGLDSFLKHIGSLAIEPEGVDKKLDIPEDFPLSPERRAGIEEYERAFKAFYDDVKEIARNGDGFCGEACEKLMDLTNTPAPFGIGVGDDRVKVIAMLAFVSGHFSLENIRGKPINMTVSDVEGIWRSYYAMGLRNGSLASEAARLGAMHNLDEHGNPKELVERHEKERREAAENKAQELRQEPPPAPTIDELATAFLAASNTFEGVIPSRAGLSDIVILDVIRMHIQHLSEITLEKCTQHALAIGLRIRRVLDDIEKDHGAPEAARSAGFLSSLLNDDLRTEKWRERGLEDPYLDGYHTSVERLRVLKGLDNVLGKDCLQNDHYAHCMTLLHRFIEARYAAKQQQQQSGSESSAQPES